MILTLRASLSIDTMFSTVWRLLDPDFPVMPTQGSFLAHTGSRMDWLVEVGLGLGAGGLAWCIMSWITPSAPTRAPSPRLFRRDPPFCGAKPNCVERDRRGARWKPLA